MPIISYWCSMTTKFQSRCNVIITQGRSKVQQSVIVRWELYCCMFQTKLSSWWIQLIICCRRFLHISDQEKLEIKHLGCENQGFLKAKKWWKSYSKVAFLMTNHLGLLKVCQIKALYCLLCLLFSFFEKFDWYLDKFWIYGYEALWVKESKSMKELKSYPEGEEHKGIHKGRSYNQQCPETHWGLKC